MLPAAWVQQAQRVRRWFAMRAAELLRDVDVLPVKGMDKVQHELLGFIFCRNTLWHALFLC